MSISRDNVQLSAEIYLFDTIIQNWDRCVPNPNILVKGDRFLMIDHGEAFIAATGTDAERDYHTVPWMLGGVQNHAGEFEAHPLWSKLRPKNRVDFVAAADRWKHLPNDVFDLIAADVPPCWNQSAASRIVSYLNEAVKKIDAIVANVEQNFER
nr:HipA family kinase [Rhodobacter sp. SY28-1]